MAEKKKTTAKSSAKPEKGLVKKTAAKPAEKKTPAKASKPVAKPAAKKEKTLKPQVKESKAKTEKVKKPVEKKGSAKKEPVKQVAVKKGTPEELHDRDVRELKEANRIFEVSKKEASKKVSLAAEKKALAKTETVEKTLKKTLEKSVEKNVEKTIEKVKDKAPAKLVTVVKESVTDDTPILMRGVKKIRSVFFTEVNEQEDRSNKKKVSSEAKTGDRPTLALRHKASLAEETPEELHDRVIRELEEANRIFEAEIAHQFCTRCCINPVSFEFRVDKDLGYCEECAAILKLGQSKEARQTEYNMNFGRADDDDDEDFEDGPSADDLKDAEDDLEDDE